MHVTCDRPALARIADAACRGRVIHLALGGHGRAVEAGSVPQDPRVGPGDVIERQGSAPGSVGRAEYDQQPPSPGSGYRQREPGFRHADPTSTSGWRRRRRLGGHTLVRGGGFEPPHDRGIVPIGDRFTMGPALATRSAAFIKP